MHLKKTLALGILALSSINAYAFPIAAAGTEGNAVIVAGTNPIVATYEGNSASYSNDLYLELDGAGLPGLDGNSSNDLFIFNNHGNAPGDTATLGSFALGMELVFRLHVNNTGFDYFSGAASRNPDGAAHARVQNNWAPSTTLVSFEDLYGLPEGVNGYNDLSFSFSNTRSQGVPEALNTGLCFGLVLSGLFVARRLGRKA